MLPRVEFTGPFARDVANFRNPDWLQEAFPACSQQGVARGIERALVAYWTGMQWMLDRRGEILGSMGMGNSSKHIYPCVDIGDHTTPTGEPLHDTCYHVPPSSTVGTILLDRAFLFSFVPDFDSKLPVRVFNTSGEYVFKASLAVFVGALGTHELVHHLQFLKDLDSFAGIHFQNHVQKQLAGGYSEQPHEQEARRFVLEFVQHSGGSIAGL